MKKIYTKTVFKYNNKTESFCRDDDESEFYLVDDDFPVMQMKGGSDSPQTQSSTTQPWGPQQPYLRRGFAEAENAFLNEAPYMMEFDPASRAAHAGILGLAGNSPLSDSASKMVQDTLRGDYLHGGSGFNAALDAARNEIIPKVQSEFASRGRTGSGLAQTAEAGAIGDKFAGLYENERQNQLRAGQLAPMIDEMRYAGFDRMNQVGEERRKLAEYNANARRNAILKYMGAVQGNYGGTTETTGGGGAGSGGMTGWKRYVAGAGAGAMAGAPLGPWGMAAGAGLGLLGAMN